MRSKGHNWFTRSLALAAALFVLLPSVAVAQNRDWRREQRRDRREDRRERRRDRREDRQERREEWREDRREARRGRDWGQYGNWGGSNQLRQTALNAGYNNGIQEGRKDRSRGERFNYADEGDYRDADQDYSSRLGNRSLYQRFFRQGFQNGYRDGYNGY
jgi:hypothetical protein